MDTTLAKPEEKETALAVFDYGNDAGDGFDTMDRNDYSIPFITVLQDKSKPVEDGVEGAEPGVLYNTITQELYPDGVNFQPCYKESWYVEWVPRKLGGGLVTKWRPEDPAVVEAIKKLGRRPDGPIPFTTERDRHGDLVVKTELVQTVDLYCLLLNEDGTQHDGGFGIISFTSTKLKAWRKFNTAISMIKGKPPLYGFRAHLSTVEETNKVGQDYFNLMITPIGKDWKDSRINPATERDLFVAAKKFKADVQSGVATADPQYEGSEGSAASEEDAPF